MPGPRPSRPRQRAVALPPAPEAPGGRRTARATRRPPRRRRRRFQMQRSLGLPRAGLVTTRRAADTYAGAPRSATRWHRDVAEPAGNDLVAGDGRAKGVGGAGAVAANITLELEAVEQLLDSGVLTRAAARP